MQTIFSWNILFILNDMETLSQKKANVIFAHNKGYYVDKDGNVFFNGKENYRNLGAVKNNAHTIPSV